MVPLVRDFSDSPFFFPVGGAGFLVTSVAVLWGLRPKKYGWIAFTLGIIVVAPVAGSVGATATLSLFSGLNGALDFGLPRSSRGVAWGPVALLVPGYVPCSCCTAHNNAQHGVLPAPPGVACRLPAP